MVLHTWLESFSFPFSLFLLHLHRPTSISILNRDLDVTDFPIPLDFYKIIISLFIYKHGTATTSLLKLSTFYFQANKVFRLIRMNKIKCFKAGCRTDQSIAYQVVKSTRISIIRVQES